MSRDWTAGPVPNTREGRLALAREISARAQARFGATAVGLYGSVARGEDGPYSDLELLCVVPGEREETFEWIHAGWKVEVDVCGRDWLLRHAQKVEGDWAITHALCFDVKALHDPDGFFPALAAHARAVPDAVFETAIATLIVDELYEAIGKLRSARARGEGPPPGYVYFVAKLGYWIIGLANRRTYPSATRALADSLAMPDRPPGYDAFCRLALAGAPQDERIFEAGEELWRGVAAWTAQRGLAIEAPVHLV